MSKKKKEEMARQDAAIQKEPDKEVPKEDAGVQPCPNHKLTVTPKIEAEYVVVMMDCPLKDHQEPTEDKVLTDPVYIELSISQNKETPKFDKGAKLEIAGDGEVKLYAEKELTTAVDISTAFSNEKMMGAEKLKLWAVGIKAGKCTLKLTVEASDNAEFTIADPVELEIGVVELKMQVFEQDKTELGKLEVDPDTDPIGTYHTNLKNLVLPAQIEINDEKNKVKKGRLLHEQNNNDFGRAKLVLAMLETAHLPNGCDDYDIVINETNVSGAVEICDAEFDGSVKAFPVKIKLRDLKAAEKTVWVQGKTATDKWRDVRVDCGLDRDGGKGPAKTEKRNGSWARFTVVKIREVKVEYTAPAGGAAAWDMANHRFYINFKNDPDGRKITISAQLSWKAQGIPVYFMLAPDKNNLKTANWGVDMPVTWKWKDVEAAVKHLDKTDRKKLLHISVETNADGYAEAELTLSRFGGDLFWPSCYISEDPHLAKYIDGHVDLEKKKPVKAANSITVWRKFWYHEVKVSGLNVHGFGNAADTYDDVKTAMVAAPVTEMPRATANTINPPVIYPKHMVSYYLNATRTAYINNYPNDNGDALIVGDNNRSNFFNLVNPAVDMPVKFPMLNAHALWVADGSTATDSTAYTDASSLEHDYEAAKELLDPPLQGGTLLRTGRWTARDKNPATGGWMNMRSGNLAAGDLYLDPGRSSSYAVKIKNPAGLVLSPIGTEIKFTNLSLRGAVTYLGTSYNDGIVNSYTPNDVQDFINTIDHEIGHSLKQVTKVRPAGIPAHPHQYDQAGSHCNYTNQSCLMYESGPQPAALNRYCPVCHPYLLVQDMFIT